MSSTAAKPTVTHAGIFERTLKQADPEIYDSIVRELDRQQSQIELIASENIVSRAVLEAQGSVMTNKYAEGLPGKRYYNGCEFVDIAENLAIERAKKIFGCGFANVQPHSGAQANQAVFMAVLKPGDTFMGLDLAAGGHLTHGSPANQSGKWFNVVPYTVRQDDHRIDMDMVAKLAEQHKPKLIIAGGSAYPRFWDFARFRAIADSIGAIFMVDMAHFAGLVAGGTHPSPFPHAHVATTTTHKTLRGPRGGMVLTNDEALAKKINSAVFPGLQGGPLMHVIAGKAVAFGEALTPEFKSYAQAVVDNAKAMAGARLRPGVGRHRQSPDADRPALQGPEGQCLRRKSGAGTHHGEQERRALRSGEADGHLGHPRRQSGRHHARLRCCRIPPDRRPDCRCAGRHRQEDQRQFRCRTGRGRESGGAVQPLPDLYAALKPES